MNHMEIIGLICDVSWESTTSYYQLINEIIKKAWWPALAPEIISFELSISNDDF